MMHSNVLSLVAFTVLASCLQVGSISAEEKKPHPSVTSQPRIDDWWFIRHGEKIGQMKKEEVELLMVGDSITANWETQGAEVWKQYYADRKAVNLGFGGDRTNHVLWRLDHLPELKKAPKAAVVLIGTNNICWGSDTPRQGAEGVQAVAKKLHELYPETKILVLGVLPRREKPDHGHRKEIVELNSYLPDLLKGIGNVTFLDISEAFLDDEGVLSKEIMPDGTHPSPKGHEIWAKAMEPELKKLLGE